MFKLIVFSFLISISAFSAAPIIKFKKAFSNIVSTKVISVKDTISEAPINDKILIALDANKKILGFIREIVTTTGCNSACLPVIYTSYYTADGKFMRILSEKGLTKKNHAPFTESDYFKLEEIVLRAPENFQMITHPKQMTDALTGETLKQYENDVVKEAAYTSLRVHVYNQDTLKLIQNYLSKPSKK